LAHSPEIDATHTNYRNRVVFSHKMAGRDRFCNHT
jgi:hypothetical protein